RSAMAFLLPSWAAVVLRLYPSRAPLKVASFDRRGGKIGRIGIDAGLNGITNCQNFRRRLLRQTDLRLDVLCFRFHRCPFNTGSTRGCCVYGLEKAIGPSRLS